MYTHEQIKQAVFHAQQDPSTLANMIYDLNAYVRSSLKQISAFYLVVGDVDTACTINETAKTIALTVPAETVVTALVAKFVVPTYITSIKVGSTAQVSGTTANDFTSAVSYVVTAKDGSTATYVVTVTIES